MAQKEGSYSIQHTENAVVLLGNLNVGKTSIFERLCRGAHHSFNYPGTPVWASSSRITGTDYTLLDTPGIHSVFTLSEDESLAWETVLTSAPRILVVVGDAKNLVRSLSLFLQITEYDIPVVLDLNMMDEARQRGISIDVDRLSKILGVPVNTSVAVEGIGLRTLKRVLPEARTPVHHVRLPQEIETYLSAFGNLVKGSVLDTRAAGLQVLAEDPGVLKLLDSRLDEDASGSVRRLVQEARNRIHRSPEIMLSEIYTRSAQRIADQVQSLSPPYRMPFADKLGVWSRNVATGVPIAALVLALMYLIVGEFGAQFLVGLVEGDLFGRIVIPAVRSLCLKVPFPIFERAITGEFGLVSVGLTLALGVVVPVLFTFFLAFAALEDSGYLARLSILLERVFRRIGLTGKGVFPIIMGFSCVTMAILTTRILESKKERIIATLLLLMGMPCAPLLSVMLVILGELGWKAYAVVFGILAAQMFLVGFVAEKLLPGYRSLFFMEIPPLRVPRFKSILTKTIQRIVHFTSEAIPIFLLATFVLFVLNELGFLRLLEYLGKPVLESWLGLPAESIRVVISTIIRREAGAALLKDLFDQGVFNDVQAVLLLLICTFLLPCVNALVVTYKERGVKTATFLILFVSTYAILAGVVLHYFFVTLNIQFR
ncbi:MAG: ferrous iron transporter B [Deltaproteobacteria bacterium]|nr:ferrous iron transporter B [Deltaproteobacteria bacterium]